MPYTDPVKQREALRRSYLKRRLTAMFQADLKATQRKGAQAAKKAGAKYSPRHEKEAIQARIAGIKAEIEAMHAQIATYRAVMRDRTE